MDEDEFKRIEEEGDIDLTYRIALDDEKYMMPAIRQLRMMGTEKAIEPLMNLARARPSYTATTVRVITQLLPQVPQDGKEKVMTGILDLIGRAERHSDVEAPASLEAIDENDTPDSRDVLLYIAKKKTSYRNTVLTLLATPGNDNAIPAIRSLSSQFLNPIDQARFISHIGTPAAIEALKEIALKDPQESHAVKRLANMGLRGLNALKELLMTGQHLLAEHVMDEIENMRGADVEPVLAEVKEHFKTQLQAIGHVIATETGSTREKIPLMGRIMAYRKGDLPLAIDLYGEMIKKGYEPTGSELDYMLHPHTRKIDDDRVFEALKRVGTVEAGTIILGNIQTEDQARKLLPYAIGVEETNRGVRKVFDKFPQVAQEILETLDPKDQKTFDIASDMCVEQRDWLPLALESLKHNPMPDNLRKMATRSVVREDLEKIIQAIADIKIENAAMSLTQTAWLLRRDKTHDWPKHIMEILSTSGQERAAAAIGEVGVKCDRHLDALETLIYMKRAAADGFSYAPSETPDDIREIQRAMLPLAKFLGNPAYLYKTINRMSKDEKGALTSVFSAADAEKIVPIENHFTDTFNTVQRNHAERKQQQARHRELWDFMLNG